LLTIRETLRKAVVKGLNYAAYLARRGLFRVWERLVPVDDKLWCFCTWESHYHTLDNPRAVLEAALRDRADIKAVVLQKVRGGDVEARNTARIRFVPAESLRGAWYLARSGVVLTGYGLWGMSSYAADLTRKHRIIQLWHGIPLRYIGRLYARETRWEAETPKYTAMVASSERERENLARAFAPVPAENIWVTGLPRNDFILGEEALLPPDYAGHLGDLRTALAGRRLVLYAPTWRDREEDHYQFTPAESAALSEMLRGHRAVLGIRGHANVRHLPFYSAASDGILNMKEYPDVNVVLRETEVLITDYSSIFLDFLLMDRPILHFVYDFDAYLQKRVGFLYEVDEAFPGPMSRTFPELLAHLDAALAHGVADRVRYHRVRELFHRHDGDSGLAVARRILALNEAAGGGRGAAPAARPRELALDSRS
jgi:CDP-glycerol glycerophosphotransferase